MEKSNKFYTTSSTKYPGSIKSTKVGNHLIFNIIKVLSENGGFTNCLSESQYNTIMNKGEKRLEAETNLNHSHDKLRFLLAALEDKENRKLFMKSPIISHVIKPFIAGYTERGKEKDQWSNFKPVSDCEKVLEKKASNGVLFAALTCDRANKRSPLGLDFAEVLSLLVKGEHPNYTLSAEIDEATKTSLLQATQQQINALRNNERFKENFEFKASENESDTAAEDE